MKVDPPIPLRPALVPASPPSADAADDATFRFLSEVSGAAMAWVDPRRRRVTSANTAFAALLGYRRDAIEELPLEAFADAFPRALEGRLVITTGPDGRVSWRATWRRRDGQLADVQVHALEVDRDGDTDYLVVARPHRAGDHQAATLAAAAELPPGAVTGVVWLDARGRVAWHDDAAALVLDAPGSDLKGRDVTSFAPDVQADVWSRHFATARDDGAVDFEARCVPASGAPFPLTVSGRVVELEGDTFLCCFIADATPRRRAADELARAEERYVLATQGANDGLWDWDIAGSVIHYSSRWAALIGHTLEGLAPLPSTWLGRVHPDDRLRVEGELNAHLDGGSPTFESEHRLQHRDGTFRWVLHRGVTVRGADGRATRMVGSTSDITHRKNAEARLRFEAFHDPLTGLANRSLMIRRVQQALDTAHTRGAEHGFAILFIDIDDFKLVNDSLGHTLGDMLLRAIASRLKRCVRAVDTVARLGGDEFCLLLEHVGDLSDVLRVADRIQEEFSVAFNLRGYEIFTSASVGVAFGQHDYQEAEEVLRDANIAMFRAKDGGRGKRAIFDHSMRRAAVNRLTLETDLRRAVERNEFEVYYQPVISLATGAIKGFEALLRWNHPKRGLVMPADFIPLAEETGLIVPLGRLTLIAACEEAMRWDRLGLGPLEISVNVSARQLALPYLVEQVAEVLAQTGLPAARLQLEITESVLMDRAESVVAKLRELRGLGVGLHIDDFGTGYSSLAYLHRFPCNTLKIDKSFVLGSHTPDEDPWSIIQTIVSLAGLLGMTVTAEGVEEPEHLARLRELGCDHVQGYLISRPVPADRIPGLVTSGDRW